MVAQLQNHVTNKRQRIHIPTDIDMGINSCSSVQQTNEDTYLIQWSEMK
jgi:hypothetical protein